MSQSFLTTLGNGSEGQLQAPETSSLQQLDTNDSDFIDRENSTATRNRQPILHSINKHFIHILAYV
jgi:hypothetical protein